MMVEPGLTWSAPERQGGILALDLSSVVGWAYGHADVPAPLCGTWKLPQGSRLGARFAAFENELITALGERKPRLVVVEAPLPASRQASTHVARQQLGLAAYVESECFRANCEVREMPSHVVRKAVLGKGSFGSSEASKAAVMAWCASQGFRPSDHNAGDACVLWRYACMVRGK